MALGHFHLQLLVREANQAEEGFEEEEEALEEGVEAKEEEAEKEEEDGERREAPNKGNPVCRFWRRQQRD